MERLREKKMADSYLIPANPVVGRSACILRKSGLLLFCFCLGLLAFDLAEAQSAGRPASSGAAANLQGWSESFEQIVDRVGPAVVQVFTSGYSFENSTGVVMTKQHGVGSGVILDPSGYIITNAHVVAGAKKVQVLLTREHPPEDASPSLNMVPRDRRIDAQIVGKDTFTDLAVLKIDGEKLPVLELADSNQLHQGDLVLAFGSPLGLGNTVTMGMVSAIEREIRPDDVNVYVQTDAPINPGNSGGALVDASGKVVGINTMILTQSGGSEGVGLAIPSNTVAYVYGQIRANGRVRRGSIGVRLQNISPEMAAGLQLSQSWGVIVSDIGPDTPASRSDLAIGDVILEMDGKKVENVRQFGMNIYRHSFDSPVELKVIRETGQQSIEVQVREMPDDPERFVEMVSPEHNLIPQLGILGLALDESVQKLLSVPPRISRGVMVVSIDPENAPSESRLLPGDIIHTLNRKDIESLDDLRGAVSTLKSGDAVVVQVERGGGLSFVAFDLD